MNNCSQKKVIANVGIGKMIKVYLCGGIKDLTTEESSEWRNLAIDELTTKLGQNVKIETDGSRTYSPIITNGFICLDPMRRNFRTTEWQSQNEIVSLDKKDIIDADILLVNATKPSWGTAMEVLFAFERHKIIVSFTGTDNKEDWNPWLGFHSTRLTKTLDEAINYIKKQFGDEK
jgi:hypothetical protein